jgi:hypothetical protein
MLLKELVTNNLYRMINFNKITKFYNKKIKDNKKITSNKENLSKNIHITKYIS